MIGIYKIENLITHKMYIGQSRNIEERWKNHRKRIYSPENDNLPLYKAFRKYGIDNFLFEIIEICSTKDLDQKEREYIQKFNTLVPNGYNVATGGLAGTTHTITYEQVEKIKELLKYSNLSQVDIANEIGNISQQTISDINTGKTWINDEEDYPLRKHWCLQGQIIEERKCPICGKKMISKGEKCRECYRITLRKVERPSREELKHLIRTTPFTTIAKQFNVTDNAIRKWCDGYNLPRKSTEIKSISDEDWEKI